MTVPKRQYYDPILQVPGTVEGDPDLSRIELYPEGGPDEPKPKWRGRLINPDGSVAKVANGDFDQGRAQVQAQEMWPGLEVFVVRDEGQDTTHEGIGPSPRLWQNVGGITTEQFLDAAKQIANPIPPPVEESVEIHPLVVPEGGIRIDFQEGVYMPLNEVCMLLEAWAVSYEEAKNPSGAVALREAVEALKEIA